MGKLAASNIITSLAALEVGVTGPVKLAEFPIGKPTMSLAVGTQAVTMRAGLRWGREILQRAFGAGLGIDGVFYSSGLGCDDRMLMGCRHVGEPAA